MLDMGPTFNNKDLGALAIRFQGVCKTCSKREACSKDDCPVKLCRNYLGNYLRFKTQILKDVVLEDLPTKPKDIEFDEGKLMEIYKIVHELCNRCMFHADKCFMNIIYWNVETMLCKKHRKPISKRPGDQNAG